MDQSVTEQNPTSVTDDFIKRPVGGSLRKTFARVAAVVSLAATMTFYALGFNISRAYYENWQDHKNGVATQSWDYKDKRENLPWLPAGGSLALAFGAGAAAISTAKSRRKEMEAASSNYDIPSRGYYSSGGNDWFFWYWLGSSSSRGGGWSSGSSSSKDNGGAQAFWVGAAFVALAASAGFVSYEALRRSFAPEPKPKLTVKL